MKIAERTAAWRRERRVLLRVSRAAWRLEQAERERSWALASARAEGVSIRALAAAVRLSSSRVHQIVAAADLDELDAQLGELRAAGWPAPEDPDGDDDAELDGRDSIADRLSDEVSWLRQCADWLAHLDAESYPPAVNLRPSADWPDRAVVAVDLARVAGGHRPHRHRRGRTRPGPAGPGPGHRRRAARPTRGTPPTAGRAGPGVPGLLHPPAAARFIDPATGAGLGRLAGRAVPARRDRPADGLHRQPVPATLTTRSPCPGPFRKLDAVTVLTARLLPAPRAGRRPGCCPPLFWSGSGTPALAALVFLAVLMLGVICWIIGSDDRSGRVNRILLARQGNAKSLEPGPSVVSLRTHTRPRRRRLKQRR